MKTFLILLTLLALVALPSPTAAQEYLPPELAYVDAQLDIFIPYLVAFQDGYYGANGLYFQALQSHTTPPAGVEPPTDPNAHPTDQAVALAALWSYAGLPPELGWSLRVDTYYGPEGSGYVLTVETSIEGSVWTKSINIGPEAWRGNDWYRFDPNL